jgi:hypothetical protein
MLERSLIHRCRAVEDRAIGRRDRDALAGCGLARVQIGGETCTDLGAAHSGPRRDQLDRIGLDRIEAGAEQVQGGTMPDVGARPAGEHRGRLFEPLTAQRSHPVDAAVDNGQLSPVDPCVDRRHGQPERGQLGPRHSAVLSAGDAADRRLDPVSASDNCTCA